MFQPDPTPWQASAACVGLSPSVVFARRERQAAPALRACAACPVRRQCEEAVAPADSWFDGVCAGRLWRNGRPVVPRGHRRTALGTFATSEPPAPGATPAADPLDAAPLDAALVAAQLDAVELVGAGRSGGGRG